MPDPTPTPADREAAEKCRCAIADRLDNDPTPLESNFWLEIVARHFAAHARAARLEERERCLSCVDNEPEMPDDPSAKELAAMVKTGHVELCRATVRATKRCIAAAIRQEPTDAE